MKKGMKKWVMLLLCCALAAVSCSALADSWQQDSGRWWYSRSDGSYACNEWLLDGGVWYYFDGEGWMVTGWRNIDGTDCFFNESGAWVPGADGSATGSSGSAESGWKQEGSSWYYLNNGVKATDWQLIGGIWYFFDASGVMATGWRNIGGTDYYFDASGAWVPGTASNSGSSASSSKNGWEEEYGSWVYYSGGVKVTGWQYLGGIWYYFHDSGVMATGEVRIDGVVNVFDTYGAWIGTKAAASPLVIESCWVERSSYDGPNVFVRVRNNMNIAVDQVVIFVEGYDAYGHRVKSYDYYTGTNCWLTGVIYPGELSPSNQYFDMGGYWAAKRFDLTITKYYTLNNEAVVIPMDQQTTITVYE